MIAARGLDCSHRKVERADAGYDSYKTAHAGLVLSVRLQAIVTLFPTQVPVRLELDDSSAD